MSKLSTLCSNASLCLCHSHSLLNPHLPGVCPHCIPFTLLQIFDYGDIVCKMASNRALKKFDTLYHSAISFATNAPFLTHHSIIWWAAPPSYLAALSLFSLFIRQLNKTPHLSSLLHLAHDTYQAHYSQNVFCFRA